MTHNNVQISIKVKKSFNKKCEYQKKKFKLVKFWKLGMFAFR